MVRKKIIGLIILMESEPELLGWTRIFFTIPNPFRDIRVLHWNQVPLPVSQCCSGCVIEKDQWENASALVTFSSNLL